MTKEELIAALERATGPSRELDAEIAKTFGFVPDGPGAQTSAPWAWGPDYTRSIDAALTLVPGGYTTSLMTGGFGNDIAELLKHGADIKPEDDFEAEAPTLPLALCIAALRASPAAQEGE